MDFLHNTPWNWLDSSFYDSKHNLTSNIRRAWVPDYPITRPEKSITRTTRYPKIVKKRYPKATRYPKINTRPDTRVPFWRVPDDSKLQNCPKLP